MLINSLCSSNLGNIEFFISSKFISMVPPQQ